MPETQMNLEITPKTRKTKLCYSLALTNQTSLLYDERAMGLSHRGNWVGETTQCTQCHPKAENRTCVSQVKCQQWI